MHDMVTVNTWQYSTSVYGRSRDLATPWLSLNFFQPSKLFSIQYHVEYMAVKAGCQFFAKDLKRLQYDQPHVVKLL